MQTVSRALSQLGIDVVARMAQEVVRGAGVVRLQFLASEFYEAVKAELDQTPGTRPVGLGRLWLPQTSAGVRQRIATPRS
jgi:hypothetical protein